MPDGADETIRSWERAGDASVVHADRPGFIQRVDLDGNPAGEVPEAHRTHAEETLRERFRKEAEQRKAQRKVEREAEEAERAAQRRADKLNQLAAKFSRRS